MSWLKMIAELGMNINPFLDGISRARREATKFGKDLGKDTGSHLKDELAGAFGVGALVAFAHKTVEFGSAIQDLADRLDVSTTSLQEWNFAAQQNGASAENVTSFFEKIADAQTKALEGNEESLASFKNLGVTLQDLQKLRTQEIGQKIANTIKGGDIQQLSHDLKEVGGRSATALVTAFKNGVDEAGAEAHRLGVIIDEETISKMDQLGDRAQQVMQQLMGPMATFLGWINSGIDRFVKGVQIAGALSAQLSLKRFFTDPKRSIFEQVSDAFGSKDVQDIMNAGSSSPEKTSAPRGTRKFTPKAEKFDSDLLGKDISRLSVDSLAAVGGFIGRASTVSPVVDVARRSLKELQDIKKNTDPANGSKDKFSYE